MAAQTTLPSGPTTIVVAGPNGSLPYTPAGMEDLWPAISGLLAHQWAHNVNEASVQAQQRGALRDGCYLMPSPYPGHDSGDVCSRSWSHESQFFYEFCSGTDERYLWISGQLDRGYKLETLWFPGRNVAVTNFAPSVNPDFLDRFRRMLAFAPVKPVWEAAPIAIPRVVVTGFQHLMHVLWNELPALDRMAALPLPDKVSIGVLCQPFGPTVALFPELQPAIQVIRLEDVATLNATNGLVLGLGSWSITPGTQHRVRRVAAEQAGPAVIAARDAFKASHHPIFWLSVKPPKRTMSDQAQTLATLMQALRADYPNAGFILDGASRPWDFPASSNYPPWFHDVFTKAVAGSAEIMGAVKALLDPDLHPHLVTLNDISACDEVVWGEAASFYICHGGTMQNKIGWVHQTPGFIHSNRTFMASFRTMPEPVTDGPPCFYMSPELIIDDDPANYSALELSRKDQDYSFVSNMAFLAEIRETLTKVTLR